MKFGLRIVKELKFPEYFDGKKIADEFQFPGN
jgi:hypothetical protein